LRTESPVFLGFVNGLALVIFLAQLQQFKNVDGSWLATSPMIIMFGLIILTMGIIHFLPKITTVIPSSLAAIIVVTLLVFWLNLDTRTVQDVLREMTQDPSATIAGGLPTFHIPQVPFTLETLYVILPYAIILAAVGLIESLLTLTLIDEITETTGRGNQECIGQGVANTVNGFFGGMGGCAMIGQSLININSGGKGRLSGISAALFLLMFIVFASSLIEIIPIAALIGVMFIVVIATFEWTSLRLLGKVPLSDIITIVLVATITVIFDLAIAVIIGVIFSALVFAWEHAKQMNAKSYINDKGFKVYELSGPLFFGSVQNFNELFSPKDDPDTVIVDFYDSRVADHSGLEAIDSLAERYQKHKKNLRLKHLSHDCKILLNKAGKLVEENDDEDPFYYVAVSNQDYIEASK
jgi:SulP family sulfate permease